MSSCCHCLVTVNPAVWRWSWSHQRYPRYPGEISCSHVRPPLCRQCWRWCGPGGLLTVSDCPSVHQLPRYYLRTRNSHTDSAVTHNHSHLQHELGLFSQVCMLMSALFVQAESHDPDLESEFLMSFCLETRMSEPGENK